MKLEIPTISAGEPIPAIHAFGLPDEKTHMHFGPNRSPAIRWSDLPSGTRSLALICHDPDVPSVGDDVNQEGKTVPASLPRVDFFHWVLIDIDPSRGGLKEGEDGDGVVPRGKAPGPAVAGRRGRNDYTGWFAGDPEMGGNYGGYDGPCPPWNDELRHRYIFTLYALDVEQLPLEGIFGGEEARAAMQGHILGEASHEATYSLNPAVG